MESNGVSTFRHHKTPSSERFLGLFSQSQLNGVTNGVTNGDDLDEDEVFWTGDFSQSNQQQQPRDSPLSTPRRNPNPNHLMRQESFGILAALHGDDENDHHSVLNRKSSVSSSPKMMVIPKSRGGALGLFSNSMPSGKYQQSAPMKIPVLSRESKAKVEKRRTPTVLDASDDEENDGFGDGEEVLPPHEIVARSGRPVTTTFSMLEGVGRTLKGRDLRQVRNAVWRQTGFLD